MRESEAAAVTAANPHELARALECHALHHRGRGRDACVVGAPRQQRPAELRPARTIPRWIRPNGASTCRSAICTATFRSRDLPLDYHLQPPYAPGYEENYRCIHVPTSKFHVERSRSEEATTNESEREYVPNPPTPNRAIAFDPGVCSGCNQCVEICRSDVLMPNPEGQPPIVLYPDECWYCGTCVLECASRGRSPCCTR